MHGCSWVVVSFEVNILEAGVALPSKYDVAISDKDGKNVFNEKADIYDGKGYAIFDNLLESTEYTISVTGTVDDKKKVFDEEYVFITPTRIVDLADIDKYIFDEIDDSIKDDESKLLLETQACLSLLGLESGKIGTFDPLMQANLCKIEYSLNSYDGYVNYDNILAVPNNKTLNAMKDILSKDLAMTGNRLIKPFIPADYELCDYAVIDDIGGRIDIEAYFMDLVRDNYALEQIYQLYPFDIDTPEFEQLYKDEYDKGLTADSLEVRLNQHAAKNKALFSKDAKDFLIDVAKPGQRLITLAGSENGNEITVNTMVAYSYMLIDAYRATGRVFMTSTTYRDYEFQWRLYSQGNGESVAKSRNASWHYDRQVYSYVPGFSNHQYGVAVDFYNRETFFETELYKFLNEHGHEYGFYNYLIEPWHWAYLGDMSN